MTVGGDLLPSAPAALPPGVNSVLYVVNPSLQDAGISHALPMAPWDPANVYYDTTLCSAFGIQMTVACNPATPPSFSTANGINSATSNSINPFINQANALSYKWVRVTLKANNSSGFPVQAAGDPVPNNTTPICWDGQQQLIKPANYPVKCDSTPALLPGTADSPLLTPVYILTSYAVTPTGSARFAQMEIANNPPFITNAAVDSIDNVVLNGSLTVDGYDNCNCSCGLQGPKNNQVYVCVDRAGMTCDRSKYAIFAQGNVQNPGPSEQITGGNAGGPISEGNDGTNGKPAFPYDINALINTYKNGALDVTKACPSPQTSPVTAPCGWSCSSGDCGTHSSTQAGVPPTFPPSPPAAPVGPPDMSTQVTYVPGNVQLTSGATGNGILIVDGDLDIHGGLEFYGLILVKGDIKFTGGGANATNIFGAVLAGQESYVDNTLGGSAVIHFDSCALRHNQVPSPPKMMAFRELTF